VVTKPFALDTLTHIVSLQLGRVTLVREATPIPTSQLTVQALARLYDQYVSALWRSDDVTPVTDWLEARWNCPRHTWNQTASPTQSASSVNPATAAAFTGIVTGRRSSATQQDQARLCY
jgi:hypothetical protein